MRLATISENQSPALILALAYEKEGDFARAAACMQVTAVYLQEQGSSMAAEYAQRVADLKHRAGL